jgi:protein-tyrosine phosphatase
MTKPIRVLFVCLGNICRSAVAEGALRHRVETAGLSEYFEIESAGTGHWHVGDAPDTRSVQSARDQGVDISAQRARQFIRADLNRFNYIFAMDESNLRNINAMNRGESEAFIGLFLDESQGDEREVPDPYYGGGFDYVWNLVDDACESYLERMRREHGL